MKLDQNQRNMLLDWLAECSFTFRWVVWYLIESFQVIKKFKMPEMKKAMEEALEVSLAHGIKVCHF